MRDGLHELLGDKSQKVRITAAYSLAKACRESFPEVLANLVEGLWYTSGTSNGRGLVFGVLTARHAMTGNQ